MGVRVQVGRGWGGERGVAHCRLVEEDGDIGGGFGADRYFDGFITVFISLSLMRSEAG